MYFHMACITTNFSASLVYTQVTPPTYVVLRAISRSEMSMAWPMNPVSVMSRTRDRHMHPDYHWPSSMDRSYEKTASGSRNRLVQECQTSDMTFHTSRGEQRSSNYICRYDNRRKSNPRIRSLTQVKIRPEIINPVRPLSVDLSTRPGICNEC